MFRTFYAPPADCVCACSADAYELHYGEKKLKDTDRLHIGRDVSNGGLLTACVYDDQVQSKFLLSYLALFLLKTSLHTISLEYVP